MVLIVQHSPEADVQILKVREGALVNEGLLDNDGILGYDEGEGGFSRNTRCVKERFDELAS
jgi:hypothetical protein